MTDHATGEIGSRFDNDNMKRRATLDRARDCAALSKPWILPRESQNESDELPENFQSVGSRGSTTVEGKMLLAMWPPGVPFHQTSLDSKILYDQSIPDEIKEAIQQDLLFRDLTIMAQLEQTSSQGRGRRRRRGGFRSAKRMALSHLVITGDVLEQLTDDYRIKVFRRDQYITRRDSATDVLYHIVKEEMDALALTPEQFSDSGLPAEIKEKPPTDRLIDLYTLVEWQPQAYKWLIVQEVNGNAITTSEEVVSPFLSTAYELVAGEDYGRGLIELNFGDLRSYDSIRHKLLDFAALASKQTPVIDENSGIEPDDLMKDSGVPIIGRVRGGEVQGVAWLSPNKLNDFQIVSLAGETIRKDLGAAMMLESDVTPQGDRVTALQVQRVAIELDAASGGVYASIADGQQMPLLDRLIWQMEKDNLIPLLKGEGIQVKVLTGIEALSREIDAQKLMNIAQTVASLGQEAAAKIDMSNFVDAMARYNAFFAPGVIKSDEQVEQERQAAAQAQLQAQAGEKAVDVMGNVAESRAAEAQTAA